MAESENNSNAVDITDNLENLRKELIGLEGQQAFLDVDSGDVITIIERDTPAAAEYLAELQEKGSEINVDSDEPIVIVKTVTAALINENGDNVLSQSMPEPREFTPVEDRNLVTLTDGGELTAVGGIHIMSEGMTSVGISMNIADSMRQAHQGVIQENPDIEQAIIAMQENIESSGGELSPEMKENIANAMREVGDDSGKFTAIMLNDMNDAAPPAPDISSALAVVTTAEEYEDIHVRVVEKAEELKQDPMEYMKMAIDDQHERGFFTDAAHDKLLEIQQEAGTDSEKYGRLMEEANEFLSAEAGKIDTAAPDVAAGSAALAAVSADKGKDATLLTMLNGSESDANLSMSDNPMAMIFNLIMAFVSGKPMNEILEEFKKGQEGLTASKNTKEATSDVASKEVEQQVNDSNSLPSSPDNTDQEAVSNIKTDINEEEQDNDVVENDKGYEQGVNDGALTYVLRDLPSQGAPDVDLLNPSSMIASLFSSLSNPDSDQIVKTDARAEPEAQIQIPLKPPEEDIEIAQNKINDTSSFAM